MIYYSQTLEDWGEVGNYGGLGEVWGLEDWAEVGNYGGLERSGDADSMWSRTADCIKIAAER